MVEYGSRAVTEGATSWRFPAIGTEWQIDTDLPMGSRQRQQLAAVIDDYDVALSRFRADSTIMRLARGHGEATLPPYAVPLFSLFDELYELTDGAMNPTVGHALEQLGYDAEYHLVPHGTAVAAPPWERVARDGARLSCAEPTVIDVGAAGKGQLVDLLAQRLTGLGYSNFTIDAGGDIGRRGPSIRVALEHPADPTLAIGVVELADRAIAGSAINRRSWGPGLHHMVDARTGRPTDGRVIATWAVAPTVMLADAMASALFFVDPCRLLGRWDFQWVRVFDDLTLEYSDDLPGEVFT